MNTARLRRLDPWLPWAAAALVVLGTCFTLWFHEFEPDLDAMGLFNAVYTALKTGHTTYPVYAYPGEMVVHPPTHYWILAQIMRVTGWTGQAAALVPVAFWVAVAAILTAGSRWRPTVKIAVLLATWFAIVIWAPPNYIRPDVAVAAAWIAGLVGLETGRIAGWRPWRLAVGSFAIALASMLHYPATLAVVGVAPYLVAAVWRLSGRARVQAIAALVVPGGVLLLLYAFIFVFPHYADIRYITSHQNAQGHGFFAAFDQTRQEYAFFARAHLGGPVITVLMWPLFNWGIPAALVGPPVLALRRSTRGLALASLPYLFTLLFYAREKTYYYYAPDVFIYFAALGVAFSLLLEAIETRMGRRFAVATIVSFAAAVPLAAFAQPALSRLGTFRTHPLHADMDVARAAGARMLPPHGTVLTNDVALWYVTGAAGVYYPRDFDETLDASHVNFRAYLGHFAAVAEESYDTWTTKNAQNVNVTSLLRDGELHIRGFYFGRSWMKGAPTIVRYLLLSVKKQPLRGYAWDGNEVWHFAQGGGGTYSLVGATCPLDSSNVPHDDWQTSIFLPGAAANTLSIERHFRIALIPRTRSSAVWAAWKQSGCRRVFEQRLARTGGEPVRAFLADWHRSPQSRTTMRFPQAAAAATSALYRPTVPLRVVGSVDLSKTSGFGSTAATHSGNAITLSSGSTQFTSLFQTDLPDPHTSRAWIRVRMRVVDGLVGLCTQNTQAQGCISRITAATGPEQTLYLTVGDAGPHLGLYIDNRGSVASTIAISSIQVVAARR